MARQLVRHGHFLVNGRKVDIPSYRVSESDIVEVLPKSQELTPFIVARAEAGERQVPAWLEVIPDKMRVLVHAMPASARATMNGVSSSDFGSTSTISASLSR